MTTTSRVSAGAGREIEKAVSGVVAAGEGDRALGVDTDAGEDEAEQKDQGWG
jgi:hypothetical protein